MSVLNGRKVLLAVSGGIAAYKTAQLVRLFIKAGAEVQVILTDAAKDFVTPLTLSTLSKREVFSHFYNDDEREAKWNNHVELALWADLMLIAPATANTLSKMAHGVCDNLLLATYLSAKCPVYFAPAMDLDMYKHETSKENFARLQSFDNIMIPAESGELASGLSGEGRMAEPENIISFIENHLLQQLPLRGKKVLITAGPTYEPIDPVRFVGNHSTGKMGYDLAEEAARNGAEVFLVSGPSHLHLQNPNIHITRVQTADQMHKACLEVYAEVDIAIAAAAVADYRPKNVAPEKIKKKESCLHLELEKTVDILADLGSKKAKQFLVGFALETENEFENACLKIERKNLNLIVLNSLRDAGAGFGVPTNKVTLIDAHKAATDLPLMTKENVAAAIFQRIIQMTHA
ncbi:bifunctional phosphopantothenoylcysteine decarboxylase/phosphopantothenate--cysteine ligase CoaBC [Flavobacterium sp.]|uniref:bifunctional phosphopantothenoylcysteine decarboxylase/phosphopantothenate--cysteine ligase CoaBC n=1 Tax=Flavobacterium sp. TaxID=239 RepID=UPI003B9D7575